MYISWRQQRRYRPLIEKIESLVLKEGTTLPSIEGHRQEHFYNGWHTDLLRDYPLREYNKDDTLITIGQMREEIVVREDTLMIGEHYQRLVMFVGAPIELILCAKKSLAKYRMEHGIFTRTTVDRRTPRWEVFSMSHMHHVTAHAPQPPSIEHQALSLLQHIANQ